MTRLSNMNDPDDVMRRFEQRITNLENKNPLSNSSFSGRLRFEAGATIVAGTVTILQNGIELPWGAGRQSLRTILDAIDNRAQLARDRADSAHDRVTTVSNNLSNVSSRVDTVNGRVDTVSTRSTNALNRANSAYSLAQGRATVASVTAARNRADSAYSLAQGRATVASVNAVNARLSHLGALYNQLRNAAMIKAGSNPPPAWNG